MLRDFGGKYGGIKREYLGAGKGILGHFGALSGRCSRVEHLVIIEHLWWRWRESNPQPLNISGLKYPNISLS